MNVAKCSGCASGRSSIKAPLHAPGEDRFLHTQVELASPKLDKLDGRAGSQLLMLPASRSSIATVASF